MDDFLHWLGRFFGEAIRLMVEALESFFGTLFDWLDQFFQGLADALGIDISFVSLVVLVFGLWLLYGGARAIVKGRWVGAIVRLLFGVFLLSALIE